MAAVTSLGNSCTTTAGARTVVATPAINDLVVCVCMNSDRTTAQAPTVTDNNADGDGTYTQVKSATARTSLDSMWVFVRNNPIRSATSTTFTMTPVATDTGGGIQAFKITGMNRAGSAAVKQSASQDNQAAAGTPAPAYGVAALTGNCHVGAILNATNPATMTPPASWTEQSDLGYITPTTGFENVRRDSGFTGTTVTWGGTSASAFASIVVEFDVSTPIMDKMVVANAAIQRASSF